MSRSNPRKDLVDLVRDYARIGVSEYWIADARGDQLDLRVLVLAGRGFEEAARDRRGWVRSPTFERRFRLRQIVNAAGLVDYRLDARR